MLYVLFFSTVISFQTSKTKWQDFLVDSTNLEMKTMGVYRYNRWNFAHNQRKVKFIVFRSSKINSFFLLFIRGQSTLLRTLTSLLTSFSTSLGPFTPRSFDNYSFSIRIWLCVLSHQFPEETLKSYERFESTLRTEFLEKKEHINLPKLLFFIIFPSVCFIYALYHVILT